MQNFLERPVQNYLKKIKTIHILIAVIIIVAVITRTYNLGVRVMSHDEVNHVVPAFDLYAGRGYRHDPITHGPLQFHLMAVSYFLFGDNDFTSRLPHALFSIATVAFILIYFRRYLGKYGSIAAAIFFIISPFMMFYGRYARNEAINAFLAVVALYLILRYYEEGRRTMLFLLALTLSFNFTSKETTFIFTAELLIFTFILTLTDVFQLKWDNQQKKQRFFLFNIVAIAVVAAALVVSAVLAGRVYNAIQASPLPSPPPGDALTPIFGENISLLIQSLPFVLPLAASLLILTFLRSRLNWDCMASSRSFDLLIMTGTLVLPLLSPFPVKLLAGMVPTAYGESFVMFTNIIYLAYLLVLSVMIGSHWDNQFWWKCALVFFGIFVVLYTTFFTNTVGLITGLVGSLGYWLAQHGVKRGGQPYYYYAFILIPIYEFLAAFGTLCAFYFGLRKRSFWMVMPASDAVQDTTNKNAIIPLPSIFLFWTFSSLIAYTIAGEKMPWLTVHIAVSMLLGAAWAFEELVRKYNAYRAQIRQPALRFALIALGMVLAILIIYQLLGNRAPFQGNTQQQLQNTNHFLFLVLSLTAVVFVIHRLRLAGSMRRLASTIGIILFILLALVTARTAYQASFINYDYPFEFLVYAHAADGPKIMLEQIEEISRRTTGGLDINIAYDNHALYPFWWYLRNYPNRNAYLENPTRALEEAPLIIAGSDKYAQIDAIVRDNYYTQEYMRLWWPMQDYWNLNWERISRALSSPDMRQALMNIWLNRDYSLYAQVTNNQQLTLENWGLSERMRLYIRKDIAAQMWQYQTETSLGQIIQADPYTDKLEAHQPDLVLAGSGSLQGELNAPRGVKHAADGSIFVADSRNHRIQQFSSDGAVVNVFGSYANVLDGEAPGGTFNEPWDVAIGADGSIYVADTFNHRIQKFSPTGRFIKSWGVFAQGDGADTFWGPRGIAVAPNGNVLITDTGNKRVVVFDRDLNFLTQFGGGGFGAGQFDEPVGIDVDAAGQVVVADTWNRRVQLFRPDESGLNYSPVASFDVAAWYGQSMYNKPYIAFTPRGSIILSDPEAGRLLEFSIDGEFIRGWYGLSPSEGDLSQPFGLDFDANGKLWVSDGALNQLMRFTLP